MFKAAAEILIILLCADFVSSAKKATGTCPGDSSFQDGDLCYYHHTTLSDWGQAEGVCLGQQGLLVIFDTPSDASTILTGINSPDRLWVGLKKEGQGDFVWSDGSSLDEKKWSQYVTADITSNSGCVAVNVTDGNVVGSILNCTERLQFVCQVDIGSAVWTGWSTWSECSAPCGEGTRSRQRTCLQADSQVGDCNGDSDEVETCMTTFCPLQDGEFRATGSKVDYHAAKSECESQGAQLPVLKSQADHDTLVEYATNTTGKNSEVWLGLYYSGYGDVFEWADGTLTTSATFEKWAKSEPKKVGTEMAVALDLKVDGWRTHKEADDNHVICQGRPVSTTEVTSTQTVPTEGPTTTTATTTVTAAIESTTTTTTATTTVTAASESTTTTPETTTTTTRKTRPPARWQTWEAWSDCSATCGSGERKRQRTCSTGVESDCTGDATEKETCNLAACSSYDWETWGEWSTCSQSCDGGDRSRSRRCVDSVSGTAAQDQCKGKDSETEKCNKDKCGRASWEEWGQWSACSSACGKGSRSRERTCLLDGIPSNDCKGDSVDDRTCVMVRCRGLSKIEIVERIEKDMGADRRLDKLHKWAKTTQHMNENIFNAQNLHDWIITGHVMQSFPVPSRMRCLLKCMGTDGCKSLNFRYTQDAEGNYGCELNSVTRDEAVKDLKRQTGYTVFDLGPYVPYI